MRLLVKSQHRRDNQVLVPAIAQPCEQTTLSEEWTPQHSLRHPLAQRTSLASPVAKVSQKTEIRERVPDPLDRAAIALKIIFLYLSWNFLLQIPRDKSSSSRGKKRSRGRQKAVQKCSQVLRLQVPESGVQKQKTMSVVQLM